MPDATLATVIAQFGAAGLIAWMWLCERRAAALREQQLAEAHERILAQQTTLDVLLRSIDANTRALTALEVGHHRLLVILERWSQERASATAGAPAASMVGHADRRLNSA